MCPSVWLWLSVCATFVFDWRWLKRRALTSLHSIHAFIAKILASLFTYTYTKHLHTPMHNNNARVATCVILWAPLSANLWNAKYISEPPPPQRRRRRLRFNEWMISVLWMNLLTKYPSETAKTTTTRTKSQWAKPQKVMKENSLNNSDSSGSATWHRRRSNKQPNETNNQPISQVSRQHQWIERTTEQSIDRYIPKLTSATIKTFDRFTPTTKKKTKSRVIEQVRVNRFCFLFDSCEEFSWFVLDCNEIRKLTTKTKKNKTTKNQLKVKICF